MITTYQFENMRCKIWSYTNDHIFPIPEITLNNVYIYSINNINTHLITFIWVVSKKFGSYDGQS
jgi:hypothetical protein